MSTKTLDLSPFTGSEEFYRHQLVRSVLYTEGARYVFQTASAYWLLDKIATTGTMQSTLRREDFQVWRLKVEGSRATLTCEDGNHIVLHTEEISWTDFPEPGVELWMCGEEGGERTIILPSEY